MKKIIILAACILMCGCSYGNYSASNKAASKADLHFVGIPTLAGAVGSSAPIGNGYSITAKHVEKVMMVDVVAYHPVCDVAIIRKRSNLSAYSMRVAIPGERVNAFGYAAMIGALPVESSGNVKDWGWLDDSYNAHCRAMTSTAGVAQGMSGGAVVGSDGRLIGIAQGYNRSRGFSIIIPVQSFAPWVESVTGIAI